MQVMSADKYRLTLTGTGFSLKRKVSPNLAQAIISTVLNGESEELQNQIYWEGKQKEKLTKVERDLGKKAAKFLRDGRQIGQDTKNKLKEVGFVDENGNIKVSWPGTWPWKVYQEVARQVRRTQNTDGNYYRICVAKMVTALKSTRNAVVSALVTLEKNGRVKRRGRGRGTRWLTSRFHTTVAVEETDQLRYIGDPANRFVGLPDRTPLSPRGG